MNILSLLALMLAGQEADAHPFTKEEYSLRTAVKVSEKGVVPLVALELPIDVVLKGIGTGKEDPREVKKRKIRQYNESQWNLLADSLVFTVDGVPAEGEWLAIEHPSNGRAAEGFFVYLVSFRHDGEQAGLVEGSTIVIENSAYPDAPMVYTGSASAEAPYAILSSTSKEIIGASEGADLSEPERWSKDSSLRKMTVVVGKKED
jgi:hypothetical protein